MELVAFLPELHQVNAQKKPSSHSGVSVVSGCYVLHSKEDGDAAGWVKIDIIDRDSDPFLGLGVYESDT